MCTRKPLTLKLEISMPSALNHEESQATASSATVYRSTTEDANATQEHRGNRMGYNLQIKTTSIRGVYQRRRLLELRYR